MTGISGLNPGLFGAEAASGGRQALATSMSFQEALQAAEQSTNCMFGFDELGIFGREAAVESSGRTAFHSSGEDPAADGHVGEASVGADRAVPDSVAQVRDDLQAPENAQMAADISAAGGSLTQGAPTDLEARAAEAAAFAERPVTDGVEQLAMDIGVAAPDGGLVDRQSLPTATPTSARLAVMIRGGRAFLVARDFALGEDDRDRLEKKAAEVLAASNLSLGGLTLNGIAAGVSPAAWEEA